MLRTKDILSLFLIIDKIKKAEQISKLQDIPQAYFDELEQTTPVHLRKLVREVVAMFLMKLDIPKEEMNEITNKIMKRGFSEMFGLTDGYSVTKTREEARREAWIEAQKKTTEDLAKKMLLEGISVETISRITQLSIERIIEIQEELRQDGLIL